MYQIHTKVKHECVSGAILPNRLGPYALCMTEKFRRTFIREWRQHRGKTLVQVAEQLHLTHGQLSRIERGQQPYNQELLERLADLFMCDVVDLIMRDPSKPEAIWSIWDHAKPAERAQIVAVAEALVKRTA